MAVVAAAGGLLATASAVTGPAAGASLRLSAPTRAHVVATSGTSIPFSARSARNATGYRLYVSSRRSDVYVANLRRARASSLRHTARMTVGGLRYATAAYYYRVAAFRGAHRAFDATIHTAYLRPGAPGGARASGSAPTYLTWTAGPVTGYRIEQATNAAMTTGRRAYTVRSLANQLTPYGLAKGRTYWFRVRALNHSAVSGPSATVRAVISTSQQALRVMTYNVLEGSSAGQVESGRRIPSWAARRAGVVGLIRGSNPDVLAVQEAAAWVGQPQGYGGRRQVDDLTAALGGGYALAATEIPPSVHKYRRTGNYLLYKSSAWSPTSTPGHWDLGDGKWAAYQVLRSRSSTARVLVVSAHLAIGTGAANDAIRQRETNRLLADAAALAGPAHLPVVYAGDFNSDVNRNHAFDGPGIAMRAAHVADAEKVARRLVNSRYNSANLYLPRPPAVDQSIDYVYAGPGVAVASRTVVLKLTGGRFVGVIPSDHNPVLAQLYVSY